MTDNQEPRGITVDTSGHSPAADPGSPAFDLHTWQEAVDKAGGIEAMTARMKEAFADPAERARQYLNLSIGQIKGLPEDEKRLCFDEMARQAADRIAAQPGLMEALRNSLLMDSLPGITKAIESAQDTFRAILPTLTTTGDSWNAIAGTFRTTLHDLPEAFTKIKGALPAIQKASLEAKAAIDSMLEGDGVKDTLELWQTLTPYMDAEFEADPDLYDTAPLSDLIAAAARRARADGKQIPTLKAEQGQAEQLEMDLNLPTEETAKEDKPQDAPIAIARSAGAITTLGNRAATIADKMLQYCFTAHDLRQLPGNHDDFLFDAAGKLNELSLNGEPLQPLDDPHTGFLMTLLRIADICDLREYNSKDNPNVGVYLPAFFRETGIDPRPRERDKQTRELKKRTPAADEQTMKQLRVNRFIEFMRPLDNRVGVIDGEGYYTLARFISWDERSDTALISIPYEIKLVELARLHTDRHSAISTIFHADIVTENQAAVELANRIAVGLIERGVTRSQSDTYKSETPRRPIRKTTTTTAADGTKTTETLTYQAEPEPLTVTKQRTDDDGNVITVTRANPQPRIFRWESRFDTLIADCPQLQRELDEIRSSGNKDKSQRVNKKLKDTFTAAIRIIMEKSDAPQYYAGLTIKTGKLDTFKAPTNSTLSEKLVITHKGKNPNYAD